MPARATRTQPAGSTAGRPCGCPEGDRAALTRRHLFGLAAAAGLATATTASGARIAFGATPPPGDVLVVLSLRGGFDGLSAVVPAADPGYYAARPQIAVPASLLKKVDPTFGLHPAMAPLYPLWDAGHLAAVHAVGQADPTRSHFEAMAEMERAAPGSALRTGWIDRTIGTLSRPETFAAVQVGSATLPQSLYGQNPKFSMTSLAGVKIDVDEKLVALGSWQSSVAEMHADAAPTVSVPLAAALASVATLRTVPEGPTPAAAGYPATDLGQALHDVARLVLADVGVRFATVDFGDWDMHQNVGGPGTGWMHDQLTELSTALSAFAKELGPALGNVTLVTLSEFGRRVAQNGSGGLDHGHGNAVLVLGGGVRGGKVYGPWPGLAADRLDQGDLAGVTDYRSVMAEVLTRRCGVGSMSTVFPGWSGTGLGLVSDRA